MNAYVDTFKLINGVYVPHVRDAQGMHQVAAAAQPGPAYQFMCARKKKSAWSEIAAAEKLSR